MSTQPGVTIWPSALMSRFAGEVLQRLGSYGPIFVVAAFAYAAALVVVHGLTPRYRPLTSE